MEDRLRKVEEAIAVHSTVLVEHKNQIDELKDEFHTHEQVAGKRYIEMKDSINDLKVEMKGTTVKIGAIVSGIVVLTTLFGGPLAHWAQTFFGWGVQ